MHFKFYLPFVSPILKQKYVLLVLRFTFFKRFSISVTLDAFPRHVFFSFYPSERFCHFFLLFFSRATGEVFRAVLGNTITFWNFCSSTFSKALKSSFFAFWMIWPGWAAKMPLFEIWSSICFAFWAGFGQRWKASAKTQMPDTKPPTKPHQRPRLGAWHAQGPFLFFPSFLPTLAHLLRLGQNFPGPVALWVRHCFIQSLDWLWQLSMVARVHPGPTFFSFLFLSYLYFWQAAVETCFIDLGRSQKWYMQNTRAIILTKAQQKPAQACRMPCPLIGIRRRMLGGEQSSTERKPGRKNREGRIT